MSVESEGKVDHLHMVTPGQCKMIYNNGPNGLEHPKQGPLEEQLESHCIVSIIIVFTPFSFAFFDPG